MFQSKAEALRSAVSADFCSEKEIRLEGPCTCVGVCACTHEEN